MRMRSLSWPAILGAAAMVAIGVLAIMQLAALPTVRSIDRFTLCHGSLRDPLWEYVTNSLTAGATLARSSTPFCCNGHTHVPALFREFPTGVRFIEPKQDHPYELNDRTLINPGSVGQPRDGDPRAAYGVIDTDAGTVTFYRSSYRVDETQRRIRARGLPEMFADRLAFGV